MEKSLERILKLCEWVDFRNVQEFLNVLRPYDYRVVGGVAVAFYTKKRIPSKGDLDVLVDEKDFQDIYEELESKGWELEFGGYRDRFEYVLAVRGEDELDILVDGEILWRSGYRKANLRGIEVKIIEPEWLAVLKLIAGREKDLRDLALLIESGACNREKLERIVSSFLGEDYLEELENLEMIGRGIEKRWFEEKFLKEGNVGEFWKELANVVNRINSHPYVYVIHCPYCYGLKKVNCSVCGNKRKLEYLVPPPFKNWEKYLIEKRRKTGDDVVEVQEIVAKD